MDQVAKNTPLLTSTEPSQHVINVLRPFMQQELGEITGNDVYYRMSSDMERVVLEEKGLYPNVDLYSGSLYRYLGIPDNLFTPLFECSRVAGQAAHVLEQHANNKIIRPAGEYVGPGPRTYPLAQAR